MNEHLQALARRSLPANVRAPLRRVYKRMVFPAKVAQSLAGRKDGAPFKVVFGGHWSNHPGWMIVDWEEQDITKPLRFPDAKVDVIFTEHVVEHLELEGALAFFREALRILRPGGYMRIVCPGVDRLIAKDFDAVHAAKYCREFLGPRYFPRESSLLSSLGLSLESDPHTFVLNSAFRLHLHRFIWSADLLVRTLRAVGFSRAEICSLGQGSVEENCIERRRRGVYLGTNWAEDRSQGTPFDMESIFVEAHK